MILSYFNESEPTVLFDDAVTPKKGRTLILKGHVKFELNAQSRQEDTNSEWKLYEKFQELFDEFLNLWEIESSTHFRGPVKYDRKRAESLNDFFWTFNHRREGA